MYPPSQMTPQEKTVKSISKTLTLQMLHQLPLHLPRNSRPPHRSQLRHQRIQRNRLQSLPPYRLLGRILNDIAPPIFGEIGVQAVVDSVDFTGGFEFVTDGGFDLLLLPLLLAFVGPGTLVVVIGEIR